MPSSHESSGILPQIEHTDQRTVIAGRNKDFVVALGAFPLVKVIKRHGDDDLGILPDAVDEEGVLRVVRHNDVRHT